MSHSERKQRVNLDIVVGIAAIIGFTAISHPSAGEPAGLHTDGLIVGTKEAPPFAMKDTDGRWTGISIDLWSQIAEELGIMYRFEETDLPGLLEGVESGAFSLAAAAITVTPERELRLDFSHPFHTAGLGIAVNAQNQAGALVVLLRRVLSVAFIKGVAVLAIVLFAVGATVWVFERRRNPNQFGGPASHGLGSGFWWSAVTMTTVGYGDKAPITLGGRIVALLWIFASVLIVSSVTGTIASALTVGQLVDVVQGPADLASVRVGVVTGSTGESYVRKKRLGYTRYHTAEEGLNAIRNGQLEAMVYDAPLLKYLVNTKFPDRLRVIPGMFQREDYVFALPAGSALREDVNRVLIRKIQQSEWQHTLFQYLGPYE